MFEDTHHIEIEPRTQDRQLTHHLFTMGDLFDLVQSFHRLVYTRDSIEIILPFILQTDVIAIDNTDLQLVDIGFHRNGTAAFVCIVGTNIEDPVRTRTRERFIISEIVRIQTGISSRQQSFYRLVIQLVRRERTVRSLVQQTVARSHQHGTEKDRYLIFDT